MSFAADLSRFASKTSRRGGMVIRKICFDLFSMVVRRWPVDTGRSRAANQISLNSLPAGAVMEFDPNGTVTIARGGAALASYKLGDVVYISNNVEYALVLEFGHSDQAPEGAYRISVAEMANHLRGIA
jgi:hypothetical protein